MNEKDYVGTCHCGAVRFEVEMAPDARISRCNCTICRRTGATSATVKPIAFRLLAGQDNLSVYEFGGHTAERVFCKTCGIHCYSPGDLEQLGGAYVAVNVNCIDNFEVVESAVVYFDGRHDKWDAGTTVPWPVDERSVPSSVQPM